MGRKPKHDDDNEEKSNERWLLTYSDMITLLLALFIILYSMSQVETKKFQAIADQFGNVFHTSKASAKGSAGSFDPNASYDWDDAAIPVVVVQDPLTEIYNELSDYVEKNDLEDQISLENAETYVRIRIQGVLMFYPDSPKMLESSQVVIKNIAGALIDVYDKVDHITITGHTADVGEHTAYNDAVSWNLSANRADSVRKALVSCGLKEDKLSLEGYGHYRPVAPNDTEANRAKNRRAEITVYKYSSNDGSGSSQEAESTAAEASAAASPADDTVTSR